MCFHRLSINRGKWHAHLMLVEQSNMKLNGSGVNSREKMQFNYFKAAEPSTGKQMYDAAS